MAYSVSAVGLRDTFPRFNKIVLQVGLQTLNNLRRCHSSDTTLTHELSLSLSLSLWPAWLHHCHPYTQNSISSWSNCCMYYIRIPLFHCPQAATDRGLRLTTPEDTDGMFLEKLLGSQLYVLTSAKIRTLYSPIRLYYYERI